MANAYVSLERVKGSAGLNLGTGTTYDTQLRVLIENVSRGMDRYTNRAFFWYTGTLDFDGDDSKVLLMPDLISVTTLLEDTNMDGTFETGWASADYVLYPLNAQPTSSWGGPYTQIHVSTKSDGTQDHFLKGQRVYRISGSWGYQRVRTDSARNGTLADGTTGTLTLSGGTGSGIFEVGMTLVIDSEQVYVTGSNTGTTLTVERAANASTGTAHTDSDIFIVQYPGPVTEACFIQVSRVWKRKDSAFANRIGMPQGGEMLIFTGIDPDVKLMLSGYRKAPLGVGY